MFNVFKNSLIEFNIDAEIVIIIDVVLVIKVSFAVADDVLTVDVSVFDVDKVKIFIIWTLLNFSEDLLIFYM